MAAKGDLQKQHLATPLYLVSPQYVDYMLLYIAVCGNIIAFYIAV